MGTKRWAALVLPHSMRLFEQHHAGPHIPPPPPLLGCPLTQPTGGHSGYANEIPLLGDVRPYVPYCSHYMLIKTQVPVSLAYDGSRSYLRVPQSAPL